MATLRKLTPQLQEKAIKELNEDPDLIEENLKEIKEWLLQHPNLTVRVLDDQWLLSFLRGSKFNLSRTKEKIENYYKAKDLYPHLMKFDDPFNCKIQKMLDENVILIVPKSDDSLEPMVMLSCMDNFDVKTMNFDDMIALCFIMFTILMIENDNYIISGITSLNDSQHFPLKGIFKFTPNYVRNVVFCITKAYPLRLKAIYFHNMNYFMSIVLNVLRIFLPKKLKERVLVFNKTDFENLYERVPKKLLPSEYGGDNGSFEDIRAYWKKKIATYAEWLKNEDIIYKK